VLVSHAREGTVKWSCGNLYALAGIAGAALGSTIGKAFDGQKLLFLFSLLIMVVGVGMFRSRSHAGLPGAKCNKDNAGAVLGLGAGTGVLAGFFGIGGGFLIVLASSPRRMPIINAVGTSLVAVTACGCTTAINYASSGYVDWPLAVAFILGGAGGGMIGTAMARHLFNKGQLTSIFAGMVLAVALYMLCRSLFEILG